MVKRHRDDEIISRMNAMQQWQSKHEVEDHNNFTEIHATLADIKDNHLAHMQTAAEAMAVNMVWIKRLLWGVLTGIGLLALKALGV